MDLFYVRHIEYLTCADKLTGWPILYHLKPGHATTSKVIICQQLFHTYGTAEELSSNGSPPSTSSIFQQFLETWCRKHRLFLVAYPQSNGQVELTVKFVKRIINGNTSP